MFSQPGQIIKYNQMYRTDKTHNTAQLLVSLAKCSSSVRLQTKWLWDQILLLSPIKNANPQELLYKLHNLTLYCLAITIGLRLFCGIYFYELMVIKIQLFPNIFLGMRFPNIDSRNLLLRLKDY